MNFFSIIRRIYNNKIYKYAVNEYKAFCRHTYAAGSYNNSSAPPAVIKQRLITQCIELAEVQRSYMVLRGCVCVPIETNRNKGTTRGHEQCNG